MDRCCLRERANAFFDAHDINPIVAVLTDNGSGYRGKAFDDALGEGTRHLYTPALPATGQ